MVKLNTIESLSDHNILSFESAQRCSADGKQFFSISLF